MGIRASFDRFGVAISKTEESRGNKEAFGNHNISNTFSASEPGEVPCIAGLASGHERLGHFSHDVIAHMSRQHDIKSAFGRSCKRRSVPFMWLHKAQQDRNTQGDPSTLFKYSGYNTQ